MTQQKALEMMKTGKNIFLTGEPGSGKTFTVNLFTDWLNENLRVFAITASTGIAATHINGVTIHSWAGIGIKKNLTEGQIEAILEKPFFAKRLRSADVLIIDEVSMLDAQTLDDVDAVLKAANKNDLPFGGIQVVFVGDFFQLPPVSREGTARFAFEAKSWEAAAPTVCYITEQHRQTDEKFVEILTAMRQGRITADHKSILLDSSKTSDAESKLFTHNVDVDFINHSELKKIEGMPTEFIMKETGLPFIVEAMKKHCLSPERLLLKVGAVVMFTRNNFDEGYVNGTLGKVIELDDDEFPVVETRDGATITVKPAEWSIEENGHVKATIKQIPLRLAWAITVHKSQGMSLDAAIVDLSKAFEYGQGYVAISRVRSLKGLRLEGANEKSFEMHPKVVEKDKEFRKASETII